MDAGRALRGSRGSSVWIAWTRWIAVACAALVPVACANGTGARTSVASSAPTGLGAPVDRGDVDADSSPAPDARRPLDGSAGSDAIAMRGVLVDVDDIDAAAVTSLRAQGFNTVVLALGSDGGDDERAAANRVIESGLELFYWIEIARDEALADAHPEWMASVQGHDEWRRLWPDAPRPGEGEVIKVWPWTPILYAEVFDEKLRRVTQILDRLPAPKGVFLNDLQAAPSACGCGHPLCRWTTDYGPIVTATRLGSDAASRFVRDLRARLPSVELVPVWATECEEHDGASDGACAGVGCFRGACWREYAKQLAPLVDAGGRLGVLLTYKTLGRDLAIYGTPAGWVRAALDSFRALPPEGERSLVPPAGLLAILQGWDVTPEELRAQIARAREAGVASHLVARKVIESSWEPRLHRAGAR